MQAVGVIGAGQMGAGIAQVSAAAGYRVILSDVSVERAEAGKAGIAKLLARAVEKEKIDAATRDATLARIEAALTEADGGAKAERKKDKPTRGRKPPAAE